MTPAAAKTYVSKLREKYPTPIPAGNHSAPSGSYCVGGALCRQAFDNNAWTFPDDETIDCAITRLNPHIAGSVANDFAVKIIATNDRGDFDGAWRWLERALCEEDR